jgi:chromosome partitioning protein
MGKIYAVANQKGGVGKSTTVVNLAAYLGTRGKKVLCIDLDPQGNTTSGFGIKKKSLSSSVYEVLIGQRRIQEAIVVTEYENVSVVPSHADLAGGEIELVEIENRVNRLKMQLITCRLEYDYIFIDCPPSLSLLTLNGLCASDGVIVPLQCEFYSLEGLSQLWDTIKLVKQKYNPTLDIKGIVFTMFDSRLNLTNQVVNEVKKHFPNKVFDTVIPRNVRLSEAPSYGMPVFYYDRNSKGAEAYESLGLELMGEKKPLVPAKRRIFGGKK